MVPGLASPRFSTRSHDGSHLYARVYVFTFAAMSLPFSTVAMFFQELKVPSPLEAAGLVMVGVNAIGVNAITVSSRISRKSHTARYTKMMETGSTWRSSRWGAGSSWSFQGRLRLESLLSKSAKRRR